MYACGIILLLIAKSKYRYVLLRALKDLRHSHFQDGPLKSLLPSGFSLLSLPWSDAGFARRRNEAAQTSVKHQKELTWFTCRCLDVLSFFPPSYAVSKREEIFLAALADPSSDVRANAIRVLPLFLQSLSSRSNVALFVRKLE